MKNKGRFVKSWWTGELKYYYIDDDLRIKYEKSSTSTKNNNKGSYILQGKKDVDSNWERLDSAGHSSKNSLDALLEEFKYNIDDFNKKKNSYKVPAAPFYQTNNEIKETK